MAGFEIENYLEDGGFFSTMAEDVRRGLTAPQKSLPPKYFYDEIGSELFERITELPEYYPMRAEGALLDSIAAELMASLAPDEIVELGSGSSTKTRALLDASTSGKPLSRYVAFDVSESIIRFAADALLAKYPALRIHGIVGDFQRHMETIPPIAGKRLVLFLGSTIGNLYRDERTTLLDQICSSLGSKGHLLLGVDLVKDIPTIEAAYNDAAGVTAAFNRNILRVINNGLGANFDPDAYVHRAHFNVEESRIEMHLRPSSYQVVYVKDLDLKVDVRPEETIWTESSHKFTRETTTQMLRAAGMKLDAWFSSPAPQFGLALASRA